MLPKLSKMSYPKDKIIIREENKRLNQKERSLQKEILESYPVNAILSTGMKCNNRCIFCTDRSPKSLHLYDNLSFEKLVELCEPLKYATTVGLYGWGEPLLNPDYERMFDYVVENFPGIEINISTNGILVNGKWIRKFVSGRRLSINVSLNAANAKTYQILAQNDQFNRIIENVKSLLALREKENKSSPEVVFSFVAIKENIMELPDFIRLAAKLGVNKVVVQDLILLNQSLKKHSLTSYAELAKSIFLVALKSAREVGIQLFPFVPVYFLHTDSDSFGEDGELERKISGSYCIDPWIYLMISMEGDVTICCYSKEIMGNLLRERLADIWNGEKYRYFRSKVNSSDPPKDCKKCPRKVGMTL